MTAHDPRTARTAGWASARILVPLVLLLAAATPPARAAQSIRPYEVTVTETQQPAAFDAALRLALVRATGRRDAPDDPAFAALLAEPRRFVLLYRPVAEGLRVSLDGAALDRAIGAAGGRLWPREREVVMLGYATAPPAAELEALRVAAERAAAARGLPLSVATAPLDAAVGQDAALALARARGADALLIGVPAPGAAGTAADAWNWRLVARSGSEEFAGSVDIAVDRAADALSRQAIEFMQQPEEQVIVAVQGVTSFADHVLAARLLGAVPGVRAVMLREIGTGGAVFSVAARGGPSGLVDALAAHAQLRAVPDASERLTYQLRRN
jgi:hypothetical protein